MAKQQVKKSNAKVRVTAIATGYYQDARRYEGQSFFMEESLLKFDSEGNLTNPKWVVLAEKYKSKEQKDAEAKAKSDPALNAEVESSSDEVI
jgi:hypothetical protein